MNLTQREAREKYLELTREIQTGILQTALDKFPIHSIPMTLKRVEDDGNILFFSKKDSEHNQNIQIDAESQIVFSDPSSHQFLIVYGETIISHDRELIKELYSNIDNNWFENEEDTSITILKFQPFEGQYWDTKSNALSNMIKLGFTALTGTPTDIGTKGKLTL